MSGKAATMAGRRPKSAWKILDKDLGRHTLLERGTAHVSRPLVVPGLAGALLILCALVALCAAGVGADPVLLVAGGLCAGWLLLNIGANDAATALGPIVGARAARLSTALSIVAIAEVAGALLAGPRVSGTIASGLIDPAITALNPSGLARVMLAGLLAGGAGMSIATLMSASVSAAPAIVGGVVGAGIVAFGAAAVNWPALGWIAAGWVIAPLVGGAAAAGLLAVITARVVEADDPPAAARQVIPVLIGAMAGTFTTVLLLAGPPGWTVPPGPALLAGGAVAGVAALISHPVVALQARAAPSPAGAMRVMFSWPLVIAGAAFSFAHGANDVATAIGPLAAIAATMDHTAPAAPVGALLLGGIGVALGLVLFGPRLVRVLGKEITKLNTIRSCCVLVSAAATVTGASALGLPVSSSHVALGSLFGLGLFHERREARLARATEARRGPAPPPEEQARRHLVRRSLALTMMATWIVTLPASGLLAAAIFALLQRPG